MQFIQWHDEKSYGNHMKANIEENIILICHKIKAASHYIQENVVLLITISNIFRLEL